MAPERFMGKIHSLATGNPAEAARGVSYYMGVADDEIYRLMTQGVGAIERERGLKAAVATGGADARSLMTTATATGGGATVATTRARGDAWGVTAQMVARRGWKKANRRVEVILKESIPGLGETDEVASVRPGRARNHLVPCGLATYVNEEKLAAAKERLARREAERAMEEEGAEGANGDAISAEEEEKERKVRRACEV